MNTAIGSDSEGLLSEGARTRQSLANFVMSCVSCIIAVNVFFSSSDICHQVLLHSKRWYLRLKATQRTSLQ